MSDGELIVYIKFLISNYISFKKIIQLSTSKYV